MDQIPNLNIDVKPCGRAARAHPGSVNRLLSGNPSPHLPPYKKSKKILLNFFFFVIFCFIKYRVCTSIVVSISVMGSMSTNLVLTDTCIVNYDIVFLSITSWYRSLSLSLIKRRCDSIIKRVEHNHARFTCVDRRPNASQTQPPTRVGRLKNISRLLIIIFLY